MYVYDNMHFFSPQALCDVILEAVFPTSAMFLLADIISDYNSYSLSVLGSGEAHHNIMSGALLAGSMGEGLTMQLVWGHSTPDADLMILLGAMLGVTIPDLVPRGNHHEPESIPSSPQTTMMSFLDVITSFFTHSTEQMEALESLKEVLSLVSTNDISILSQYKWILDVMSETSIKAITSLNEKSIKVLKLLNETNIKMLTFVVSARNKSCLEYAPDGCPLAYTQLRGTNIKELPHIYAVFFEEENGHNWLKTSHLNQFIQQYYNVAANYPATPATIGGPAGQVRPHGPLAWYVKLQVAHAAGMPGTFSPPPRVRDSDIHHGTCVTRVVTHAGIANKRFP